jgi:hypothetical protein
VLEGESSPALGALTSTVGDMKEMLYFPLSRVSMYFRMFCSSFLLMLWIGKENHDNHNYTWPEHGSPQRITGVLVLVNHMYINTDNIYTSLVCWQHENPKAEDIECLCKLLTTIGLQLDTVKARAHMDVYFKRIREMSVNPKLESRHRFMLRVCSNRRLAYLPWVCCSLDRWSRLG